MTDAVETIRWLLEGDPAIRWQVQRDLLGKTRRSWQAERTRTATEGWGADLLARQETRQLKADEDYSVLRRSQRVAIFLIFVFTAVATPSGDPFTMIAMAVPVCILFEISVLIARVHDARKARREAAVREQHVLDDAIASSVDPFPSPLPPPGLSPGDTT